MKTVKTKKYKNAQYDDPQNIDAETGLPYDSPSLEDRYPNEEFTERGEKFPEKGKNKNQRTLSQQERESFIVKLDQLGEIFDQRSDYYNKQQSTTKNVSLIQQYEDAAMQAYRLSNFLARHAW